MKRIAEPSAETTSLLLDKHPTGPLPITHNLTNTDSIIATSEEIIKALRSFPKDTACARSGQRVTHLLETLSSGIPLDDDFTIFVNNLIQGKAPLELAPLYASANLIAIQKKDSSIRPIAVGEVVRRLVSKLCLRKVISRAIAYLAPFQQGIGVSDAIETILHGLNRLLQGEDLDENTVFLLLDLQMISMILTDNTL